MTTPRRLLPHDPALPAVLALVHGVFAEVERKTGARSPALDYDLAGLRDRLALGPCFAVFDGPRPLAVVLCRPSRDYPDALYLGTLAVAPQARGKGLARRLLTAVEDAARRQGAPRITLDTWDSDSSPRDLFLSLGFRIDARADGIVAMSRAVPAPRRLHSDDPALDEALALIRAAFAFMDGIVDPPSTVHLLTPETLRATAAKAEVWALGDPIAACVILTPKPPVLYLGKLAVDETRRGGGLARALVDLALVRARDLGLAAVELGTRIELTGNQRAFTAMGFVETARECHPGFDRPTAIVYTRPV